MEKIKITIVSVHVHDNQTIPNVELQFAETIEGYQLVKGNNGVITKTKGEVTAISFQRSQLTRELCNLNELIADYKGCRATAFDQKAFSLILRGATLTIVREAYAAGEIIPDVKDKDGNDVAHKNDGFTTHVVGVQLTDKAIAKLDAACTLD